MGCLTRGLHHPALAGVLRHPPTRLHHCHVLLHAYSIPLLGVVCLGHMMEYHFAPRRDGGIKIAKNNTRMQRMDSHALFVYLSIC